MTSTTDEGRATSRRLLLIPVGKENYGLSMEHVIEVVPKPQVTRLPSTTSGLRGVFNARGQIIPLFDSAALLGGEPASDMEYVVVIDTVRGHAALTTTGVPEAISPPNPVNENESADQKGMYVLDDGRIVTELNIDALLESMSR